MAFGTTAFRRILVGAAAATLLAHAGASAAETLRLAHAVPMGHIYQHLATALAQKVADGTKGQYEVRIFPNGQLGQESALADSLRSGNIDIAFFSSNSATVFVKQLGVFSLPYLFNDAAHLSRVLNDPGFIGMVDAHIANAKPGYRRIAMLTSGVRNLYANTKVLATPDDLRSTKIRVQPSPVEARVWSTLGALPVSIPLGDVYTSMQTGLIQAYEGPIGTFYSGKMYEVAPNVALTEHQWSVNFMFISERTWAKLPENVRKIIQDAGAEFDEMAASMAAANDAKQLDELKSKYGVKVGPADKAAFAKLVASMIDENATSIGATDLLKAIRAAGTR